MLRRSFMCLFSAFMLVCWSGMSSAHEPFEESMHALQKDMDHIFMNVQDSFDQARQELEHQMSLLPSISIVPAGTNQTHVEENKDQIKIIMTQPGADFQHVDVHVQGRDLVIQSENRQAVTKDQKDQQMQASSYAMFYHRVALPPTADVKAIKAVAKEGVLEVTIPKKGGGSI